MDDKKNIDRLFQEKFKDFEVSPDEAVWKKIKAHQDNKRKRVMIIPLWYKIGGVAALVAIIFTIGYISFDENPVKNTIVDVDPSSSEPEKSSRKVQEFTPNIVPENATSNQNAIVTSEEDVSGNSAAKGSSQSNNNIDKVNILDPVDKKSTTVATVANSDGIPPVRMKKSTTKSTPNSIKKQQVASTSIQNPVAPDPIIRNEKEALNKPKKDKIIAITDRNRNVSNKLFTDPASRDNPEGKQQPVADTRNSAIKEKTDPPKEQIEDVRKADNKKSIFDEIANKENEAIAEETENQKKWKVAPNMAPIYYGTFGDGSSVRTAFSDNSKTGEVNLSYGVQIAYNVGKKLSVRSGINKLDLGYNTQEVVFSASSSAQDREGIIYTPNAKDIVVSDLEDNQQVSQNFTLDVNERSLVKDQNPGLLNHSISYIEVPVEVTYAFIDKKFGVHMVGGISTLFLNDNEISVDAGDFRGKLGEGSNVNNIGFSGNVGLGVNYLISKQFRIQVEPVFKYQFSGFKNSSQDFRPYYFGVYTGVSFRF